MRPEDLLRAMSEIDDDLIARSDKKQAFPWKPLLSVAACLVLLLSVGLLLGRARGTVRVALLYSESTDNGKSYERAAGEALSAYYGDHRLEYTYYNIEAAPNREDQIADAVTSGCELVLLDGRQERQTILSSARKHPKATFLALGISSEELHEDDLPENVLCIDYRPEIAGYLAGYTAVMEGYTQLGYYYDAGLRPYLAYGSGYLQGIEAAATELEIVDRIQVRVSSTLKPRHETLSPAEDQQQLAQWYTEGTQMVLACGELSCQAAEAAAREGKGDVILVGGSDAEENADQALSQGIAQILDGLLHDSFEQSSVGEMPYYTLNDPDGTWGFRNVSEEAFTSLRDSLINGSRPCEEYKLDPKDYSIRILHT